MIHLDEHLSVWTNKQSQKSEWIVWIEMNHLDGDERCWDEQPLNTNTYFDFSKVKFHTYLDIYWVNLKI